MKKLSIILFLLLLTSNAIAAENQANTVETTKIAIVNMQKLLESSTAAISVREEAKKEHDQYQASVSKEEDSLRKEEAKLQEQRSILTAEVFAEKSRAFKDKVAKANRSFQENMLARDEVLKKSYEQIHRATLEIINNLAAEEGFDIALPTGQTLYANNKLDITDKVLERLNKKLPKVEPVKPSPKNDANNSSKKQEKNKKNNKKN